MDLVGTCPKDFFLEWIAEGDAAGDPETGQEWAWGTSSAMAARIQPGDRFYVVSHGRLRGYAPVVRVESFSWRDSANAKRRSFSIIRKGGAVACTIDESIPGFRGLRERWWAREEEDPFPNWRTP